MGKRPPQGSQPYDASERKTFKSALCHAFPNRLHAGSLEAIRVSRPKAVVLAVNKAAGNSSNPMFRTSRANYSL